jgi:predicted RNA-binding protein with PIN domain
MPYLIDGHNLIGKIDSIQLSEIDDERKLIELLRAYFQESGRNAEVFFDNAAPTDARTRKFSRVKAHFVRSGETADRAIARRLSQLGRKAANWTVVSSDREVQAGARRAGANVMSSEEFARELEAPPASKAADAQPTTNEVDEWLALFGDAAGDD